MIKYILAIILISNTVFAQEAVFLAKDQKSPYDGILMPQSLAAEFRIAVLERDTFKAENTSLKLSLTLQEEIIAKKTEQIGIVLEQNDKLAKTAYSERNLNNWERAGWFLVGLLAAYGSVKLGQAVIR